MVSELIAVPNPASIHKVHAGVVKCLKWCVRFLGRLVGIHVPVCTVEIQPKQVCFGKY